MGRSLFVIGSGTPWDGTRLADRHVAEQLVSRFDVLFVDPPTSFRDSYNDLRLSGYREPRLRSVGDGLWRLTPKVTPRSWYPGVRQLTARLVSRALRSAVRQLGLPVAGVLATNELLLGVLEGTQAVWARDDYAAGGSLMGISPSVLRDRQERAARKADLAIVVTPALRTKWEHLGVPATVVPNGVDPDLFAEPTPRPPDIPDASPLVGFSGTLSKRMDLGLLHAILDADLDLMMVGFPQHTMPRDEIDALASRNRMHLLGHREYEDLPGYLQAFDVGLVPYTQSEFNKASFPLKTLEYLASGVPVVATDLPGVRQLGTDLVAIASPEEFVDVVRAQAELRHNPELVADRQALARKHSWSRRSDEIVRAMGLDAT